MKYYINYIVCIFMCPHGVHSDDCDDARELHRSFYTEGPVHTDAFTTQQLRHRGACTHRNYYTEELLHTDAFTQRIFCTEKLLHTDAFTHKRSYTQKLLRKQLLHGEPLPQRTFATLIDGAKSQFHTSFFRFDPHFV